MTSCLFINTFFVTLQVLILSKNKHYYKGIITLCSVFVQGIQALNTLPLYIYYELLVGHTHTYMDVDRQTDAPNLWFNKVQVYYR